MWKSGTEHLRSIKLNLTIISMSVSISMSTNRYVSR